MKTVCFPMLSTVIVCLTIQTATLADGKFFPSMVGGEKNPLIPHQRAIIAFRDGVQTLIVESSVQGIGQDLGWVIPLPAEPTEITACKPGTLRSAYQVVGPKIRTSVGPGTQTSALVFAFSALVCALVAYDQKKTSGPQVMISLALVLLCILILLLVILLFLPSLGVELPTTHGFGVLQHKQVGAYDVKVVSGSSAEPIRFWLKQNGFALPATASPVLEEYVKAGWCFAVSRIHSDDDSLLSPHPLKFVFKAPRALYPMKLTGVDAGEMQLDLYVVGEQAASAHYMRRISSDKYRSAESDWASEFRKAFGTVFEISSGPQFKADTIGIRVGHEDVTSVMWPGCVLTHLRGELSASQMSQDFYLDWDIPRPAHKTIYTSKAAGYLSFTIACVAGSCILLPVGVLKLMRSNKPADPRWLPRTLLVCAVVVPLAGFATYLLSPKTAMAPEYPRSSHPWVVERRQFSDYRSVLGGLAAGKSPADFASFAAWWRNRLSELEESAFKESDTPGGYELKQVEDGWSLTIYDRCATPIRFRLAPARS